MFTITRNEPIWLRVWCNYYCNAFPHEDVYVLNNSTTDDSISQIRVLFPKINVIDVPSKLAFDHLWLKHVVENQQRELLTKYQVVAFSETDEFLIPDLDLYSNIHEYCVSFSKNDVRPRSLRARGWGVVHQIDSEPDIIPGSQEPFLQNRNAMWLLPDYDKTLITKKSLIYSKGFHITYTPDGRSKEGDRPIESDLSLLHGWHIDMNIYHQRHVARKSIASLSAFHGSSDLEAIKEFFRTRIEPWNAKRLGVLYTGDKQQIPEKWKNLLRY